MAEVRLWLEARAALRRGPEHIQFNVNRDRFRVRDGREHDQEGAMWTQARHGRPFPRRFQQPSQGPERLDG